MVIPDDATHESRIEELWDAICDTYASIEVASRHAFNDFELKPEDLATIEEIKELRRTHLSCTAMPDLTDDAIWILADVDRRLASAEGRLEIILLAVT